MAFSTNFVPIKIDYLVTLLAGSVNFQKRTKVTIFGIFNEWKTVPTL